MPPDTAGAAGQDRITGSAAHPAYCVDEPSEPHLDPGGDCACLADCCNADERCTCPDCGGSCGDH